MRTSDLAAQIKRRLLLSSVVKSAVELKGGGPSYIGLCPFHQEKTPSFHVRDQLGRFKCFGCGESGDVFAFIMRLRGIGFNEAVAELAEKTGITTSTVKPAKFQTNEDDVLRAQALAQSYFVSRLNNGVIRYLTDERSLAPAMIKQAGIGFGGDNTEDFLAYLRKNRVSESCAAKAGVLIFKGRLTFPIRRRDGKVIAFGGRVFNNPDHSVAKYVNTHAYSAYEKKKHFYGLFESQAAILRGQTPVLVEGYFDAMALWALGVPALALCGTALSDEHAKILKRLSAKLILCLDADEAGFKALASSLIKLWQVNISASAVTLDKNDPGDYLASGQLALLKDKLNSAKDATCLVIDRCVAGLGADIGARIREIDRLLPIFANMNRPIMRRQYVAYLAQKLHEDPALLWAEINKKSGVLAKQQVKQTVMVETKVLAEEKWLSQIVRADHNLVHQISPNLWQRVSEDFKRKLLLGEYGAHEEELLLSSQEAEAMLLALEQKITRKQARAAMGIKRQELQHAEKQGDFSRMFGNLREQSSLLAQQKKVKTPIKVPRSKEIAKIDMPVVEEEDWL